MGPGPRMKIDPQGVRDLGRLLLEDLCSDLVRFLHSESDPSQFGAVRIDREYALGPPGSYADLRVEPTDEAPYFVEVKYGYSADTLLNHLARKYAGRGPDRDGVQRVVLVAETKAYADWPALETAAREILSPHLVLEIWDEERIEELVEQCFGETIRSLAPSELVSIRERFDEGKDRLAFGDTPASGLAESVLRQNLLWHFGAWRLRELRYGREADLSQLVPDGTYEHTVVVMADMSSFSSYVRDTSDEAVVRQSLTSFYARARYQVINAGGMVDQFVGDEVIALFGVPDQRPGYIDAAVRTAIRLLDIGASVSHDWQRKIDHVQPSGGVHVAMAMGRVQLVAMRAFDRARLSVIGDCLNIAGRELPLAGPGEIVVSNVLRHALANSPYEFSELPALEAHNLGMIRPWQLVHPPAGRPD